MSASLLSPELRQQFRRATVAAARAASTRVGGGDGDAVDLAAVTALRAEFAGIAVAGRIIAGEGEKDEAPMLPAGELFGTGGPEVDIAVDPVDGTRLAAAGLPGSMVVVAVAGRGAFAEIGSAFYAEKFIASGRVPGLSLADPLGETILKIARARGVDTGAVRVAIQDRPRNAEAVAAVRAAGAECVLFEHGDVERGLNILHEDSPVDLLVGIGGAPEALIVAGAARALSGQMQVRLAPQSRGERARLGREGIAVDRVLGLDELCAGPAAIFVTAVTDCDIVPGSPMGGVSGSGLEEKIWSWGA